MKTTIYLVRHGYSTGNKNMQVIGCTDVELTEEGLRQGAQVAEYFKDKHLDAIYSSNLKRAKDTASFTAKLKNLPINIDDRFAEFNFGEIYEGMVWTQALLQEDGSYVRYRDENEFVSVKFPKGGESAPEVADRFVKGLYDIEKKHAGKKVFVATHSIALMCFLTYLKNGCTLEGAKRKDARLPNASITTIEIEDRKITLITEGYVGHLDDITV